MATLDYSKRLDSRMLDKYLEFALTILLSSSIFRRRLATSTGAGEANCFLLPTTGELVVFFLPLPGELRVVLTGDEATMSLLASAVRRRKLPCIFCGDGPPKFGKTGGARGAIKL